MFLTVVMTSLLIAYLILMITSGRELRALHDRQVILDNILEHFEEVHHHKEAHNNTPKTIEEILRTRRNF